MKHDKKLKDILDKIGAGLTKLRQKKGFDTAKAFIQHHKLPSIQYWRMESGKTNITLKSLKRILDIHKVDIVRFFIYISRL